jgi:hypothetical protein
MYYIAEIMLICLTESQKLNPGDYVAEHAGVCRREEQCTKDGETGNQSRKEKDRMELVIPGGGKWLIYQESKCKPPLPIAYISAILVTTK